jgi:uncharacterized membrane protein
MKRFDVALEVIRQLIAISSAGIFGVAAFTGSIFNNEDWWLVYLLIVLVMLLLVVSVCCGVFAMGAIANTVETAEKEEASSRRSSRISALSKSRFVSIYDNQLTARFTKIQQISFLCAFALLFVAFFVDRTFPEANPKEAIAQQTESDVEQDVPP